MLLHRTVAGACNVRCGLPVFELGQNSRQGVARNVNLLGVSGSCRIYGPQVLPLPHPVEYCFNVASLGVPRHMAGRSPIFSVLFFLSTTCDIEAPLPLRVIRDIPDETVKALVDCLAVLIC